MRPEPVTRVEYGAGVARLLGRTNGLWAATVDGTDYGRFRAADEHEAEAVLRGMVIAALQHTRTTAGA